MQAFECPRCGNTIVVPDSFQDELIRCPDCGALAGIPEEGQAVGTGEPVHVADDELPEGVCISDFLGLDEAEAYQCSACGHLLDTPFPQSCPGCGSPIGNRAADDDQAPDVFELEEESEPPLVVEDATPSARPAGADLPAHVRCDGDPPRYSCAYCTWELNGPPFAVRCPGCGRPLGEDAADHRPTRRESQREETPQPSGSNRLRRPMTAAVALLLVVLIPVVHFRDATALQRVEGQIREADSARQAAEARGAAQSAQQASDEAAAWRMPPPGPNTYSQRTSNYERHYADSPDGRLRAYVDHKNAVHQDWVIRNQQRQQELNNVAARIRAEEGSRFVGPDDPLMIEQRRLQAAAAADPEPENLPIGGP